MSIFNRNNQIKFSTVQRLSLYLAIITAFTGSLFGTIQIGTIHLFPYRYFLIFMWLLFILFIFHSNGRLSLSHIKVKRYLQYLALWLGYAFLSLLWAASKTDAIRHIILLFMGMSVIFFMVYYLRDLDQVTCVFYIWMLIFAALIPVGIWEVTSGMHLHLSKLGEEIRPRFLFAPTTVFYNQNDYAAYLAISLSMILVWIRYLRNVFKRIFVGFIFVAGIWLLILTLSRSCYIAILMAVVFWFLFLLKFTKKVKAFVVTGLFVLAISSLLPGQVVSLATTAISQIKSLRDISFAQDNILSSGTVRANMIKTSLSSVLSSAGFGVGAGNIENYCENSPNSYMNGRANVHNWWIEILANYGVFIFAGHLILYISLFWNLWKVYKRVNNRTERMICEALLVGLVSFFMASMSSSSMIAFRPQWIFIGFALAFLNYCRIQAYSNVAQENVKRVKQIRDGI